MHLHICVSYVLISINKQYTLFLQSLEHTILTMVKSMISKFFHTLLKTITLPNVEEFRDIFECILVHTPILINFNSRVTTSKIKLKSYNNLTYLISKKLHFTIY